MLSIASKNLIKQEEHFIFILAGSRISRQGPIFRMKIIFFALYHIFGQIQIQIQNLSSGRSGRGWRSWQGTRTSSWTPRRSSSKVLSQVQEFSGALADSFVESCWATSCFWQGWTFIYPWFTRPTVFIVIVLQNRLTRGLGPERSLKTCVLFPENWVLPTADKIYHHSPWVLSLIVRNTFLKSSVSWAGPL